MTALTNDYNYSDAKFYEDEYVVVRQGSLKHKKGKIVYICQRYSFKDLDKPSFASYLYTVKIGLFREIQVEECDLLGA